MIRKFIKKLLVIYPNFTERAKWVLGFKIISNSFIYKKLSLNKALCRTADFDNRNLIVCIENTLNCNARCIMCLHRNKEMRGSMPMALYKKLINECVENNIKMVSFGVYGEPLADPDFIERVKYLRSFNLEYMIITNGSLISEGLTSELFKLGGFKEIRFSINGFSKEVYEKVMVGLNRDDVYGKILKFLELKESLNNKDLTVNISCVKTKYVMKEVDKLIKFWKSRKGINRIYLLDIIDKSGDLTCKDGIGRRGMLDREDIWLPPCNELWSYLSVYYDGKVAPCCMDNSDRVLIIGDINKQPLGKIIAGEPYTSLRKMHLEGNRNKHIICEKCRYPSYWY